MKGSVRWIAVVGALSLLLAGCSTDPTTSDEYQQLEDENQKLAAQLASVTAARDAILADASSSPWVELPAEAAAALANYSEAVLAADGEAMLNYVTDDFAFISYGEPQQRDFRADYVTRYYKDFKVTVLGDPMVLGGGETYIVAEPERATTPALADGFSVFRLVRVDGAWLVDAHRFTGE